VPDLTSDRRALQQAIVHVLENAVKFSPTGSKVMLEARATRSRIVFTITDDGPGIANDLLSQICDPFFQGDSSYDRAVSGAGLGLALVKRLIDALGGELRITSRLGAGTRVEIDLPQAQAETIHPLTPQSAEPQGTTKIATLNDYAHKKSA